ncbi:unnamed protein product [Rhodiola kirilowii]
MTENGAPKLLIRKPKKALVKQLKGNSTKDFSPQQASAPPPPSSSARPPSAPVKESFFKRYKYLWPLLLTVNLAYGGYLYMRIKKQNASGEEETALTATNSVSTSGHPVAEISAPSVSVSAPLVSTQASGQTASSSAITTSQNAHTTLSAEQQRKLFRWILEEKRKTKPKNAEEKKRIDAEKAVLKQFIRAESIPTL